MPDSMFDYKRHDGSSSGSGSGINVGTIPIGMPQEVLRALNQLVFILVLLMAAAWLGLFAFFVYHFRRPRRGRGSGNGASTLENAIELYEIRRPRKHHPAEPELLIFGTAEDRQRRFASAPAPVPVPVAVAVPVSVPVVLGEYEEGVGDDSVTVWEDSSAMKD
ncbi:hypothetical protein SLS62_001535 [Diatrype stigma]|uniref:Uncharacterized protein n=1 Tax=Diatrype stigma TaxID=117547 RepID=A0AAN9UVF7_9PEZI